MSTPAANQADDAVRSSVSASAPATTEAPLPHFRRSATHRAHKSAPLTTKYSPKTFGYGNGPAILVRGSPRIEPLP